MKSMMTSWLEFFGITPQQITPLLVTGGLGFFLFWKYFIKDLKQEVMDLHHAAKEIQKYIEESDDDGWKPQHGLGTNPLFLSYGEAHSPMKPNEKGEELLQNAGFYATVYPALEKEIFILMDSEGLRTLYDYESGAERVLEKLKNNPAMDCLKEYAVNHPNEPLELIFKIASWVIRDKYAEYKKFR